MSRFAVAIYCDDIRQEVGNKVSLIGVYREKMFIPSFPTLVPKICVAIWARTPIDSPFQSMKVRLFANDKVLMEQELPVSQDEAESVAPAPPLPGDKESVRFQTAHVAIQISPLAINERTILRLRLLTEDGELRAGGLSIELAPVKEAAVG